MSGREEEQRCIDHVLFLPISMNVPARATRATESDMKSLEREFATVWILWLCLSVHKPTMQAAALGGGALGAGEGGQGEARLSGGGGRVPALRELVRLETPPREHACLCFAIDPAVPCVAARTHWASSVETRPTPPDAACTSARRMERSCDSDIQ
jgi:hypothetical protein